VLICFRPAGEGTVTGKTPIPWVGRVDKGGESCMPIHYAKRIQIVVLKGGSEDQVNG
jgi:hypothetical protein